jgi:hypothetical protein
LLALLLISANVLVPATIVLWAHFVSREEWTDIAWVIHGEGNGISWLSSVQLLVLALLCLVNGALTRLIDQREGERSRFRWLWPLMAVGFVAASWDEYFMGHELIRDQVLVPAGVMTDVPGLRSGDVVVLGYAAVAWIMLYFIWQVMRPNRRALVLLVIGLVILTIFTATDALEIPFLQPLPGNQGVYQVGIIAEELGELPAQLFMALAFLSVMFRKLVALMPGENSAAAA